MRCARRTKKSPFSSGCAASVSCAAPLRIVQEDKIEIRTVAEFEASKLAVADRADAYHPPLGPAARRTKLRRHLCPRELHRLPDDQFRHLGESVAHPHHRQPSGEVRDRDPEYGGALERTQAFDLNLGLLVARVLHSQRELVRELRSLWQIFEQSFVEQLIEQQWMQRNLIGEEITRSAYFAQPSARGRVLLQQGEVGRSRPDRLKNAERAPQDVEAGRRFADVLEERGEKLSQTPASALIQTSHRRRIAELDQRRRRSRGPRAFRPCATNRRAVQRRRLDPKAPRIPPAGSRRCRSPRI